MNLEVLAGLGLSPNEAKIYETLVERGESSVSEIAIGAKIHRRNAYDAIHRLINKGLCFEIFSSKENHYNAVDPDKLTELFAEKQEGLQRILPELKKKFHARLAPEEACIYRGYEGQKNIWRTILAVGEDVCNIGAKAQWFDPHLEASRRGFFTEANRKNIHFNLLIDHEVKAQLPDFTKNYPGKLNYRYLPKKYSTNSVTNIFGDYIVTFTGVTVGNMRADTSFFIIKSKDLAESYRKRFWYMWDQSSDDVA